MLSSLLIVVQLLSHVQFFATPWTKAHQASLSSISSQSLLTLISIESVMPSIISFSVAPFSSCPQSFSASGSFPMCWFFVSGGQNIGALASASVLPMNIQSWFPTETLKTTRLTEKCMLKTPREKISFNIYFDWGNSQRSLVMRWGAGVYGFRKVTRRDLFFCLLHSTSVICVFLFSKCKSHSLPSLTLHLCCHSCGHVEKMTSL